MKAILAGAHKANCMLYESLEHVIILEISIIVNASQIKMISNGSTSGLLLDINSFHL